MPFARSYNVECNGRLHRVPVNNEYNTVSQFTKELKKRFNFPPDIHVQLFYDNALLAEDDCLYDLNLDTSVTPIRIGQPLHRPNVEGEIQERTRHHKSWRIIKKDSWEKPMIDPQWHPSLNDTQQSVSRLPEATGSPIGIVERESDGSRKILVKCPPLLELRHSETQTVLLTPSELSTFMRRKARLLEAENQLRPDCFSEPISPTRSEATGQNSSREYSTYSPNCHPIRVTCVHSSYVLEVPYDATIGEMIDILWRRIFVDNENCTPDTHDLFLFNHRAHIFPALFEEIIHELLLLRPESATTDFYFYTHQKRSGQDPYECIHCHDQCFQNSIWRNHVALTDFHQHCRAESVFLISMHMLQWWFDSKKDQCGDSSHSDFFTELSRYIFLPAIIAIKHALDGLMFFFETSLIADSFFELLTHFCPSSIPIEQVGDLTPFFLSWLLQEKAPEDRDDYTCPTLQQVLINDTRLSNQGLCPSISLFDPFEYIIYEYYRSHSVSRQPLLSMSNEQTKELLEAMADRYSSLASLVWGALRTKDNDELILYQSNGSSFYFTGDGQHSSQSKELIETNGDSDLIDNPSTINEKQGVPSLTDLIFKGASIGEQRNSHTMKRKNCMHDKTLVVLLDISRSMFDKPVFNGCKLSTVFDVSYDMLITLRNHLDLVNDYALGLTIFGQSIKHECPITKDDNQFIRAIDNLKPRSEDWTRLYDAINETIRCMVLYKDESAGCMKSGGKCMKRILCLSDGINNYGEESVQTVERSIKDSSITIDFVSFLPYGEEEKDEKAKKAIEEIQNLCRRTGGRYHRNIPEVTEKMKADFKRDTTAFLQNIFGQPQKT